MLFVRRNKHKFFILALLATTGLSACSITSSPTSPLEKMDNARAFMKANYADSILVNEPLTIDTAVAYAIKYNLDVRVQRMEEELAQNQLLLTKLNMLPKVNAEASLTSRDTQVGARSQEIGTGIQNLNFSRSAEDETESQRLDISYNLLDYGLNYVRAQQDANRVEIAMERRQAAVNALVRDARITYMQAAVAQKLEKPVGGLVGKAEKALARSKEMYAQQLDPPLQNLNYQRDLIVVIQSLRKLQTDLATAKARLAQLLNIRMGQDFTLKFSDEDLKSPTKVVGPDIEQLEVYAIVNRPELAEADLNITIEKLEKRRIWLSMLPTVEPSISYNHDENQFLLNHSWWTVSGRVAYSLLQPLTLPAQLKSADARLSYVALQRDAMILSVLSQVNIAYIQHMAAVDNLKISNDLASVEGRISEQTNNAVKSDNMSEQEAVLAESKALLARVRSQLDYIEVDRSASQLMAAAGYDVVPGNVDDYSTEDLAKIIHKNTDSIMTETGKMKKFTAGNDVYQMAFDAAYATKSNRPWLVRVGPYKSQADVQKAIPEITKVLMGFERTGESEFMPPVPYARLDDGELGSYYLAFDSLNLLAPEQVCDALKDEKIACEINPHPAAKPEPKKVEAKKVEQAEQKVVAPVEATAPVAVAPVAKKAPVINSKGRMKPIVE